MSVNLYVVKLKPINIFNLPLALLHEALGDQVYNPCKCRVDDQGNIQIDIGKFALAHSTDPVNNFRNINWEESLASLTASVDLAKAQNKVVIFGTYRQDQIDFLKQYFNDSITTIGVEYYESMYANLLTMFAKKHIELMATGKVVASKVDSEVLSNNSNSDAIAYYTNAFDHQGLIPRTETDRCDLIIPLDDYYNILAMQQHIQRLDILFNATTIEFYNQWLEKNKVI